MVNRIKNLYARHTIGRIFLTIVLAAILVYVFVSIPVWMIKRSAIPTVQSREPIAGTELSNEKGKVVLAKNGGKTLTIDTKTMVIEVTDENGNVFSSAVAGTETGLENALLTVSYLGEDNNLYEWNSFDQSVAFGTYKLYQIDNGVRIDMNLNEGESARFYEYLPKKMSIERYEEFFKGGIEALRDSGELDKQKANRYLQTLSLVYKKSIKEECYAVTYTGNPPTSAVKQMIELVKLIGYDKEMLLEDAATFEFNVTFTEPADFDIVIEIVLEDGELTAHIPTGSCVSKNDFYTIQNIKVLPNFGAVTAEQYPEGKFLIPDGCGALVNFNSYQASVRDYIRPLYDNDYYTDYEFMPKYSEELFMPVFGAMYGAADAREKGFLAIVEEAARNGNIHMKLASSSSDSAKYNKIYASFDVAQYTKVKINGAYSDNTASYLVNTGAQSIDCTVRYLFYGEGADYFDFAKGYKEYLAKTEGMEITYDDGASQLYLEVVGALNLTKRFVGIPYSSEYSMTTYEGLLDLMQQLDGKDIIMQYDGVFNDGWNGSLNNGASLSSSNGSKSQWNKVQEYAKEQNIPLYLETTLTKVWEKGNGFRASTHAVRDYANKSALHSRYMATMGIQIMSVYDGLEHDSYYTLAPYWLSDITDKFLKDAGSYENFAVGDMAGMYYGDYRFRSYVSAEQGNLVLEENLAKLSEGRNLVLKNPHMDKIGFGNIAVDISRHNCDYILFSETIPFKQLVFNGLIDFTTEDINLSKLSTKQFVLEAAETGAFPKFIITEGNVDALKHSDYSYLYSVQYSVIKDKIDAVYNECQAIREEIGTNEIVDHECIQDGVYVTTYKNGVKVYTNYNLYEVETSVGTFAAEGYLIVKEGQ